MMPYHWRRATAFIGVVMLAAIGTIFYTHNVVDNSTQPVKDASAQLKRTVTQRREDLISGCIRSSVRISAIIMSEAASAVADSKLAKDIEQSLAIRKSRRISSAIHLDVAAQNAATLVDCQRAYPRHGRGKAIVNVARLHLIDVQLEHRFGIIDQHIKDEFRKLLHRHVRDNTQ